MIMKRLTQTDLARLTNRTQAHISAILLGKVRAGYETAEILSNITNTNISLWIKGSAQERQAAFFSWAINGKS
jgi:transcriptional regulator with XRE-family HTH domain